MLGCSLDCVQTPKEGLSDMVRLRRLAVGAMLVVSAALMLSGCLPKAPAEVTSAWPIADSERVVPRPPEAVRWPLTGLVAPDVEAIRLRPLSVKIENSPQARPQTGLSSADVVYESVAEGGITRFNAIFQSQMPKTVGPGQERAAVRRLDRSAVPRALLCSRAPATR